MSSSSPQAQLSPTRSPSFSAAFPRSPSDTPATPPTAANCSPHAPPTPPDSSSRIAQNLASSPRSTESLNTSSDFSLSTAFSSSGSQFQSRLLDTPIDIHCLAPELDSPTMPQDTSASFEPDNPVSFKPCEQGSPTPTQDAISHKVSAEGLPPAFVPAAARLQVDRDEVYAEHKEPGSDSDSRPPNVYINGLPPNFPEEDLLAMTRPFGPVLSVRTFTRHVSDKPSGYGFVLFETLDAAEKCIESLRKYRNLHPSFSKQVHKIPGTTYASVPPSLSSTTGPADSFKSKMEQLSDTASTNLYMEGLPLSITEETLRALVNPYRIMSSRFFHTRLSSPPRIIAFVRLETRTAAEDIIERLHGRLVRGWNDAGCRISVRFADTAEQRELRRTERHGREGEQSPARLTMARAALLNLKGPQYQSSGHSPTLTDISLGSSPNVSSPNLGFAFNQLGLGQLGGQVSGISNHSPLPAQSAFARGSISSEDLNVLGVNIPALESLNPIASHMASQNPHLPPQHPATAIRPLDEQAELQYALMGLQGLRARTQNGYTPVEQLILQAHARQQRASAMATHHETGQGRTQNTRHSATMGPRLSHGSVATSNGREGSRRLLDFLPQVSEDDFHAAAALLNNQVPEMEPGPFHRTAGDISGASLALDRDSLSGTQTRQRNHTLSAQARSEIDNQGLHIRSSTLPSQYTSIRNSTHSNNAHIPSYNLKNNVSSSNGPNSNTPRTNGAVHQNDIHITGSKHNAYAPTSTLSASRNPITGPFVTHGLPDTQTLFSSKNNINVSSTATRMSMNGATAAPTSATSLPKSAGSGLKTMSSAVVGSTPTNRATDTHMPGGAQDADEDEDVVSPALTYSTHTPASLSPATPYSGFFSDGTEAFKGSGVNVVGVGDIRQETGEKQKVATDCKAQ